MASFFAMAWDPGAAGADAVASRLHAALIEGQQAPVAQAAWPGFALYDLTQGAAKHRIIDGGDASVAAFGTMFRQGPVNERAPALSTFSSADAHTLKQSAGLALQRNFWGDYVAFIQTDDAVEILTDPAGSIPCYHMAWSGIRLVFSHLELCPFLDMSGFTLNRSFIQRLLAYDRILDGQTGLVGVAELRGGYRLTVSPRSTDTRLVWDPRKVSTDVFDPARSTAVDALRETIRQVVDMSAQPYDSIMVNVSGGLDSAIVLAALAGSGRKEQVTAMHHVLLSGDPAETAYAKQVADHWGLPLTQVQFDPQRPLPGIDAHPLSVRPHRQFFSLDLGALLGSDCLGAHDAMFTGQGGDHLFRVSRSNLGFVDYCRRHGLSARLVEELVNAARLSDTSVWQVLRDALPYLVGRRPVSPMTVALGRRQTPVTQGSLQPSGSHDLFPEWAIDPEDLPPAKFDQVSTLAHLVQFRAQFTHLSPMETVHPLLGLPLVELCLRLPAYRLSQDGISRGLARAAFAHAL
ncbi:MAG: asparagine synthase C-terminal domain-containing protein, partial [Alphaproteobacteria bacterium]|nr:asparagine synthase C-terminal domain-containing protein [Alphaproteobacteria bacterium]